MWDKHVLKLTYLKFIALLLSLGLFQLGAAVDAAVLKKKKGEKSKCFRCGSVDHLLAECTVILCDVCEEPEHGDADCPLLAAPKPQLQMFGFAHEELVLFQLPPAV